MINNGDAYKWIFRMKTSSDKWIDQCVFYPIVWSAAQTPSYITAKPLRKMIENVKYRYRYLSFSLYATIESTFFLIPSVVFPRSILADRFRNQISAQVSACVRAYADVLIRLVSAIDKISSFKFFASSPFFPFFLFL